MRAARLQVEILCDDAYSIERATAAGDVFRHAIRTDATRWAEVTGHSTGGGVVEIHLEVRDPAAAMPRLDELATRLGISDRIRIEQR